MKFTPKVRKRVYEFATGVVAIAIFRGLVTSDEGQLWLGLLVPVLGLARVNVADED